MQDQRASALGPHQRPRPHTRSPANIISAHPNLGSCNFKLSSMGVVAAMSTQPGNPQETGRAPANADTGKRGDANSFNGAAMVVRDTPDAIGESQRAGDEAPKPWSPGSGPNTASDNHDGRQHSSGQCAEQWLDAMNRRGTSGYVRHPPR